MSGVNNLGQVSGWCLSMLGAVKEVHESGCRMSACVLLLESLVHAEVVHAELALAA